jgi:hypothetical protein
VIGIIEEEKAMEFSSAIRKSRKLTSLDHLHRKHAIMNLSILTPLLGCRVKLEVFVDTASITLEMASR